MPTQTRKRGKGRCQCMSSCNTPPLENSPFCEKHQRFCPRKAPLSGSEPEFNPARYNKFKGVQEAHNCFAYAFDYLRMPKTNDCKKESCPIPFPQPGRASGYPKWSKVKGKRCPDLVARIKGDVPHARLATFEEKCPSGMYKIASVTDEDEDYHFYRQDSNGFWSHKPGATNVTHIDATKRPIYDPNLASRKYSESGLDYDNFCGYMCIPSSGKHTFKRGGKRSTSKRSTRRQTRSTRRQTRSTRRHKRQSRCTRRQSH